MRTSLQYNQEFSRKHNGMLKHTKLRNAITDEELAYRLSLLPKEDTRDLTARWQGDPLPNDRRRTQR